MLFVHPANEGTEFFIEFIHSVNQSPVREFFEICDGAITLIAVEFTDFGAGMPTEPEGEQIMTRTPDGIRIENFNRSLNQMNIIVGHMTEHFLHITNETISLNELAQPGTLMEITHKRLNIWQR
jgi:hypothetical protein